MKQLLILTILILSLVLLTGCNKPVIPDNNTTTDIFLIKSSGSFDWDECQARNLQDKVLMLESRYCGHCEATLPVFKAVAAEKGVEPIILDLADDEAKVEMALYNVNVQYTPTFIFGCDYYTGAQSKEEYSDLFDAFIEFQEGFR